MSIAALQAAATDVAAAATAAGLRRSTAALEAFASLAESLEVPTEEAWRNESPEARDGWKTALVQVIEASLFLLGSVPDGKAESRALEADLGRLQRERTAIVAQRDQLAEQVGRLDAGAAELREELMLLQGLSDLSELRDRLEREGVSVRARMAANTRLAEHTRGDVDVLRELGSQVEELEARREALLREAIERDEQLSRAVLERTV